MWGERRSSRVQRRRKRKRSRREGGTEGRRRREGEGRDRLKLSQGDDVSENVPLQKGALKR